MHFSEIIYVQFGKKFHTSSCIVVVVLLLSSRFSNTASYGVLGNYLHKTVTLKNLIGISGKFNE